ncbi:hypothetical protein [Microcoleus sp. bin38.metabat.b11b12b14.051]|uniref:hypothetical protein n=1 Tax=Microcoleus sp. bin38.metabat.b11b12b14.051 TaxID=2742709 RepID=UPI0025EEED82|nr:hypothetical protein [Microcoleus sp. bin38.metabat.b11b12b14.051]
MTFIAKLYKNGINTCASARVLYKLVCYKAFVAGAIIYIQAAALSLRSVFILSKLVNIGDRTTLN